VGECTLGAKLAESLAAVAQEVIARIPLAWNSLPASPIEREQVQVREIFRARLRAVEALPPPDTYTRAADETP
jgi:hypothetical protein